MSVTWDEAGVTKRGPSWSELVDQAALKLGYSDPALLRVRGSDLQILEYFEKKMHNFMQLHYWLHNEMRPPDEALREATIHKALVDLTNCHVIYTTNYDDFIERSFQLNGRACHTVAIEAHMGRIQPLTEPISCEIVKFHGDLNYPTAMVISESHYERRLTLSTPMDYRFRADVLNRAILFIGYSFNDWNVAYLFRLINDQFGGLPDSPSGRRAYIAVADPSDFEIELFRARNIAVIPLNGRDRSGAIAELLREIGG